MGSPSCNVFDAEGNPLRLAGFCDLAYRQNDRCEDVCFHGPPTRELTMDHAVMKDAIVTTLRALPENMRQDTALLFRIIGKHLPELQRIGPKLMGDGVLMQQVQAMGMEFVMGIVDMDGMDRTLKSAFTEVGIPLPELPNETRPTTR